MQKLINKIQFATEIVVMMYIHEVLDTSMKAFLKYPQAFEIIFIIH